VLKKLNLEEINNKLVVSKMSAEEKLMSFMKLLSTKEIEYRENEIDSITFRAEALRKFYDKFSEEQECKRLHYVKIYKDLKLSIFLSDQPPEVCLLYNDGKKLEKKERKAFAEE